MIDDLAESSLGFLKRKKKRQKKNICYLETRHRVCTTEEYFMHYQYSRYIVKRYYVRYAREAITEIKREITVVRYPSRDRERETSKLQSSTMIFFHS